MSAQWDVVIVGARVAGAATALPLARAGLRVLCLDRARHGSDTVSTHALLRAGVLQLARLGVLDAVRSVGTPPVRDLTFFYGDEAVPVAVRPRGGVDALYAPRRTVLDAALVDAAAAAGARFRFGTPVTGLLRDPGGRVTGVLTRSRDGAEQAERAALVIGADGRSSLVADRVGAPARFRGRAASSLVYGYWPDLPVDGYTWCYRPGVSTGVIPTNDGLTCVFTAGRPETVVPLVRAHGPEGALRILAAPGPLGPGLAGARPAGGVRFVRGAPARLRAASGPGWALVGDAGYWKDPLSAHGITAALVDAELLARAVLAAPRPGGAQRRALAGYEAARDALALPMLRAVERIAAHDWSLPEVRALLLRTADVQADEVALLEALPDAAEAV
jgi:2-polyprenyl-6-methoxyphenol hydroxylase-like FAD-dependent oxidoreductase